MASKYDDFWRSELSSLGIALKAAAAGEPQQLDVSEIRRLGDRPSASWKGMARVQGKDVLDSRAAHMRSLARILSTEGSSCECLDVVFTLTMRDSGRLDVAAQLFSSKGSGAEVARKPRRQGSGQTHPTPEHVARACSELNALLHLLPLYASPTDIPPSMTDGLYFFYEAGESTPHGEGLTRVGTHMRGGGLALRLENHYKTKANAKNQSSFRRLIGSAILRSRGNSAECLAPASGKGHWEHKRGRECANCEPNEQRVTEVLRRTFRFRCLPVEDRAERERLEADLISTFAQCPICRRSDNWLGRYTYAAKNKKAGLWNIYHISGAGVSAGQREFIKQAVESISSS